MNKLQLPNSYHSCTVSPAAGEDRFSKKLLPKKLLNSSSFHFFFYYLSSNPSNCAKAKKMAPNTKDIQWSGNKMEGGEVLKTMECLRRRLLAERQASLLAKEEAELMGKRSKELEKQITEQIQMRTKAEEKLQLLRKKLESLNLTSTMVNSEPSISSGICDEEEPKNLITASSLPLNAQAIDEMSHLEEENPNATVSASSSSSASEISGDEPSKAKIENGGEKFDPMNNSLAVITVNFAEISETGELKPEIINKRIIEVLNDLQQARERIQSSMEICEVNMIKVCLV